MSDSEEVFDSCSTRLLALFAGCFFCLPFCLLVFWQVLLLSYFYSFSMKLSLTGVEVNIFACCFICALHTGLSRVIWVGNGSRSAMIDCLVPEDVDGVALIIAGDLGSLVSMAIEDLGSTAVGDVDGAGSIVVEYVDGTGSIVADDVDGTGSIVVDDVDGTGSIVVDDVDGTGMIAADDVAVIGSIESDVEGITTEES
jgi:hypothetical protein